MIHYRILATVEPPLWLCYNLAMIIDFHTHVFSPRLKKNRQYYLAQDPVFAHLYSDEKAKLATAEELIASMDRAGIDISVIVNIGWTTPERCQKTNDYILESVARYPQRLVAFCAVQPKSIDATLVEIERCVQAGAKGIGELRADMQSFDLTDEKIMLPFVAALKKHRLPLLLHASEPIGHNYPGKGVITPGTLYPFITRFPDLAIVCAHWGGGLPFYALMPEVKKTLKNVFFDTAASPFLYRPQIYQQVTQIVGANKIIFGSDYPVLSPARLLKEIRSADLSEAEKALILAGNARKLLGIKGKT